MCGITGYIGPDSREEKRQAITRMTGALRHRGPDAWGRYVAPAVALGHTRLSIQDVKAGHQPMETGSSVIAFNGEIFNYIELRLELEAEGVVFRTHGDTEVALQALERWGPDAFARFNGQFAILFWNKKKQELLAGRDHFGIRPLFYSILPHRAVFASEMKALDASGLIQRTWSSRGLMVHGLLWNTLGGETVFNEVKTLPPATWARFSKDGQLVAQQTFYRIGAQVPEVPSDYREAREEFRRRLGHSVEIQLRSDVPVGCYLSGGIDSSVTSLLAHEIKRDKFKSFSVAFQDKAFDESEFQRLMATQLGTEHFTETISKDDIDANFLAAARHFERPVFRTAPVPMYLLSRRVQREQVKVVLTGEGADEILCGYDVFKEIKLLEAWNQGATEPQVDTILRQLYPHLGHYAEEGNTGLLRMYYEGFKGQTSLPWAGLAIRVHNNRILQRYLHPDRRTDIPDDELQNLLGTLLPEGGENWPTLKRNQVLEMGTLMDGYLLSSQGDRMAMAHGVEGRYPFLDPSLVDWCMAIPLEWKLNEWTPKYLLRDAFSEQIPEAILNRPKQPYQAPDLEAFLRQGVPTSNAAPFLERKTITDFGLFDPAMVERLLLKHERRQGEGIGYRDNMLVSFILSSQMIEYWIRNPADISLDNSLCTVDITE